MTCDKRIAAAVTAAIEQERARIARERSQATSERIRKAWATARANGVHMGRPLAVFDRDKLRTLRESGVSYKQAAGILGISPSLAFKEGRKMAEKEEA